MKARHYLLTALATLIIFLAGIGTGHRLARTNVLPLPPPAVRPPQPPAGGTPLMGRLDMFARMVRDLDLDPMQRQRINRVIGERQEYLADVVRLLDPELHEMMPRLRRDVNEILRPEQRGELERRFAERMKREPDRMKQRYDTGYFAEPRRNPEGRPDGQRPLRPGPNGNRPLPPNPEPPQ